MGTTRKLLLSCLVLGVVGAAAGFSTFSAFSGTTSNNGNTFATGSVSIGDNDAASPMYTVSGANSGDIVARCIEVTYTGSLPADVKLYTPSTLDPGAQYLDLTVEKGTGGGAFPSCAGFTPDAAPIYSGTLGAFATAHHDWASGVTAYPGSQVEWDSNDAVVYRFTITVQSDPAAMNQSIAAHAFTWEARNQ